MKKDDLLKRVNCVICDGVIEHHKSIKNFPVYMGVCEKNDNSYFIDQNWGSCINCGCLQLIDLIPYDVLYKNNHHYQVVGKIWENHHKKFADFIDNDDFNNIYEIGAGTDYLANIILNKKNIQYFIIEPDPNVKNSNITMYKGYLDNFLNEINNADTIIFSHVIEHTYTPFDFLSSINKNSKDNVVLYISFPNIKEFLKSKGANSLNFEHTFYLDIQQFEYLLNKTGFIIKKQKKYNKHSYFIKAIKGTKEIKLKNIKKEIKYFDNMHSEFNIFVNKVNHKIKNTDYPVYLYGAHVFSQLLINYGLNNNVVGILDSSMHKQNKKLYGTDYMVFDPEVIKNLEHVIVVLKAGPYQKQIKDKLYKINKNVIILE